MPKEQAKVVHLAVIPKEQAKVVHPTVIPKEQAKLASARASLTLKGKERRAFIHAPDLETAQDSPLL